METTDKSIIYSSDVLHSRIENVIDFAIDNIGQLEIKAELWNETIAPNITLADKVIIETSLLLLITKRNNIFYGAIGNKLKILGEKLNPYIRCEKNKILLMRNPQSAAVLGIGHIALNEIGIIDDEFDFLIKRPFLSGEILNTERLPYRTMDVFWLNNLILTSAPIEFENILPFTIVMSKAHPVYMTSPDVYALTHSLMYITDFGTKALNPQIDKVRISETVNAAISYHLLSDNLDILGELLMSASMLRITDSLMVKIGWKLFNNIWDKLGFLPCPTFDSSVFKALSGNEASSYAFKHLYHTTYVGGILSNLLLISEQTYSVKKTIEVMTIEIIDWEDLFEKIKKAIILADSFSTKFFNQSIISMMKIRVNNESDLIENEDCSTFIKNTIIKYFNDKGVSKYILEIIKNDSGFKNKMICSIFFESFFIHAIQEYNLTLLTDTIQQIIISKLPVSLTAIKAVEFIISQQLPIGAIGSYFVYKENLDSPEALNITTELAFSLYSFEKYVRERVKSDK